MTALFDGCYSTGVFNGNGNQASQDYDRSTASIFREFADVPGPPPRITLS
ncbi:MAG: hypothetical protein HY021_03195 [Burkholderiales bacterium]|nr:hypothetical protein [Burkholderiales bacterium]